MPFHMGVRGHGPSTAVYSVHRSATTHSHATSLRRGPPGGSTVDESMLLHNYGVLACNAQAWNKGRRTWPRLYRLLHRTGRHSLLPWWEDPDEPLWWLKQYANKNSRGLGELGPVYLIHNVAPGAT